MLDREIGCGMALVDRTCTCINNMGSTNFAFLHELEDWSELRKLSYFEGGFDETMSEEVDCFFGVEAVTNLAPLMIIVWRTVKNISAKMDEDLRRPWLREPYSIIIHPRHELSSYPFPRRSGSSVDRPRQFFLGRFLQVAHSGKDDTGTIRT